MHGVLMGPSPLRGQVRWPNRPALLTRDDDRTMHLRFALSQKLDHEVKEYLRTFAYLYVCFGALLLYKTAILRDYGVDFAPFGLAAGKALLMAKFMLIGRKL